MSRHLPSTLVGLVLLLAPIVACYAADDTPSLNSEYLVRAEKLSAKDSTGWVALATFCEQQHLLRERTEALRKVLTIDPANTVAHARLGEVRPGKVWLAETEANIQLLAEKAAKKQTLYGKKWISFDDNNKRVEEMRQKYPWQLTSMQENDYALIYGETAPVFTMKLSRIIERTVAAYQKMFSEPMGVRKRMAPLIVDLPKYDSVVTILHNLIGDGAPQPPPGTKVIYYPARRTFTLLVEGTGEGALNNIIPELVLVLNQELAGLPSPDDRPGWLYFGAADYLACSRVGLQIIPGIAAPPFNSSRVQDLQRHLATVSLRSVLETKGRDFSGDQGLGCRAIAWAFVQFLYHGADGRYAPRFRKYLKAFREQPNGGLKLLERQMGPLDELEREFATYAKDTLLPRAFINQGYAPDGGILFTPSGNSAYVAVWKSNPKDLTARRYRHLLIFAKMDGVISPEEEQRLRDRATAMGISPAEATAFLTDAEVLQQSINFGGDPAEDLAFLYDILDIVRADGKMVSGEEGTLRMLRTRMPTMSDAQFDALIKQTGQFPNPK